MNRRDPLGETHRRYLNKNTSELTFSLAQLALFDKRRLDSHYAEIRRRKKIYTNWRNVGVYTPDGNPTPPITSRADPFASAQTVEQITAVFQKLYGRAPKQFELKCFRVSCT